MMRAWPVDPFYWRDDQARRRDRSGKARVTIALFIAVPVLALGLLTSVGLTGAARPSPEAAPAAVVAPRPTAAAPRPTLAPTPTPTAAPTVKPKPKHRPKHHPRHVRPYCARGCAGA